MDDLLGFLLIILAYLVLWRLFLFLILFIFFVRAYYSGLSGMLPNDLLAFTELKLYETNPETDTLLSLAELVLFRISFLIFIFLFDSEIYWILWDKFLDLLSLRLIYVTILTKKYTFFRACRLIISIVWGYTVKIILFAIKILWYFIKLGLSWN